MIDARGLHRSNLALLRRCVRALDPVAGLRPHRRLPGAADALPLARGQEGRHGGRQHRRRLDRGEGHPRPRDAPPPPAPPAVPVGREQGVRDARAPAPPSTGTGPPRCTGCRSRRSARRRCRGWAAPRPSARETMGRGMDDDIERFEEERELELYREYRDVLPMFGYVIETERRFYLANRSRSRQLDGGWAQVDLADAWVWDMFRPARFVASVRVLTRRDVNVEELRADASDDPRHPRDRPRPDHRRVGGGRYGRADGRPTADGPPRRGRRRARSTCDAATASWPATGGAGSASSTSSLERGGRRRVVEVKTRRGDAVRRRLPGGRRPQAREAPRRRRGVPPRSTRPCVAIRFDVASVALRARRVSLGRDLRGRLLTAPRSASSSRVDVGRRRQVVHEARAQVGPAPERGDAHPRRCRPPPARAAARPGSGRRRVLGPAAAAPREVTEAHDGQVGRRSPARSPVARREPVRERRRPGRSCTPRARRAPRSRGAASDIQSFSARNRRVPSIEYWYQSSGSSSGRFER